MLSAEARYHCRVFPTRPFGEKLQLYGMRSQKISEDLTARTEHPESVDVDACGNRNGVAERFGKHGE